MLNRGDLFLIEPNVPFCYHAADDGIMDVYALRLVGPGVPAFLATMGFNSDHLAFRALDPDQVFRLLGQLMRLATRMDEGAAHAAVSTVHRLPLYVGLAAGGGPDDDLVSRVLDHVNNHMELGENVEQLSVRFGLSRHTLFARFRQRFGRGPVQVLIEKRLERAEMLLRSTGIDVADVARFTGYRSVEHFQRQFRHARGLSPGEWRRQSQGSR